MTDSELCVAWCRSSLVLESALTTSDLLRQAALVSLRRHYLDELERRDAAGSPAGCPPGYDQPVTSDVPHHRPEGVPAVEPGQGVVVEDAIARARVDDLADTDTDTDVNTGAAARGGTFAISSTHARRRRLGSPAFDP